MRTETEQWISCSVIEPHAGEVGHGGVIYSKKNSLSKQNIEYPS